MNITRRKARLTGVGPWVLFGLLGAVTVTVACSERSPRLPVDRRAFHTPEAFAASYWDRPIPLQGAPPDSFTPIEASLSPGDCGTCHPVQYADWQTSIHADAYSPGLSGQLVNWEVSNYAAVRSCLACHAPLSEQSAQVPDSSGRLVENPFFDGRLQKQGITCAACHVRAWRRHGPPRRDGSLDPSPAGTPHGGVVRTSYFEDSRFCAGCHQFTQPAVNGKPLQNTLAEWEESRYAEEGAGCQSCHMPDRRHLWRGIHDSATVGTGVTIQWIRTGGEASETVGLRVTNAATGHRFPTYVTPKVRVRVELLDGDGRAIEGGTVESVIGREVTAESGAWVERWDTRLAPDSGVGVVVPVPPRARSARGTVTVFPDGFYNAVFARMLAGSLTDTSRALIGQAHRRTIESAYDLFDSTIVLK